MFRKAIVVACHPEDNSVDLVMCDDGARLSGVPVMAHSASARSGSVDMPEMPSKTGEDKWNITKRHGQDMEALVAVMGRGNPIVVGFLYPQISQMTFKDAKRKFSRHQSDVYHTIDGNGNMELYHPSGAYVRIAESLDHEDLEKKNFDENLSLDRNKDKKVGMRVSLGGVKIDIKDGVVTIDAKKVVVPNGDVLAGSVSLKDHIHTGVRSGPNVSGPPVGGGSGGEGGVSSKGSQANGTVGNGVPVDAGGAYKLAVYTRKKYNEPLNLTGVPSVNAVDYFEKIPANNAQISEQTYYERVRPAMEYGQERIVSQLDTATNEWTDDLFSVAQPYGVFNLALPQGVAEFVTEGPFQVFRSDSTGALYAKHFSHAFRVNNVFGSIFVGVKDVFWKLTPQEFAEGGIVAS